MAKQYGSVETYEAKLANVMKRLGVEEYDYNWDRFSCWVTFVYNGGYYRFEHSLENARNHNQNIKYGTDLFAQVVLSLEDIARMTERGIYELQTWIAGLKFLPAVERLPECFDTFGKFDTCPDKEVLHRKYKKLALYLHPDKGGSEENFCKLKADYEEAMKYIESKMSVGDDNSKRI